MQINTNLSSLNAVRLLEQTSIENKTAAERLTSGLRVNKSADDAAGLAIATGMNAQIIGTDMAMNNSNDGIAVIQTLDGASEEVVSMLQRMRELAIQSLNGTYSVENRKQMNNELLQLREEIDRISVTTKFNEVHIMQNIGVSGSILSAPAPTINIHAGWETGGDNKIEISIYNFHTILAATNPANAIADVFATVTYYSNPVAGGAHVAISNNVAPFQDFSIGTQSAASLMAMKLDNGISNINTIRAKWGALQNRLESTLSNLSNVNENIISSRSKIMDADFAKESANLAKTQVLQQAGMSMLAQANQSSQNVLSLIR